MIGALGTLSTFYEENTTHEQRRLRQTIQQHDLSINKQFLTAAEDIVKAGGPLKMHEKCTRSPLGTGCIMWGMHVLLQGMQIPHVRNERHWMGCGARSCGVCTVHRVHY